MQATRSEVSIHEELIAGVHRIELPLPFELEAINLYLVRLDDGYLLIDCGLNTPQSFAALEAGLRNAGAAWSDIRVIVLTHMHPDHMGLTSRVRELSGATVLMHETEAEHLDSLEDEGARLPYLHAAYNRGGVPADLQLKMDHHFASMRKNLHGF
jgi:glyoxylase-like metal-dependent hydrolase (beta-lactamase superfamily II)